MTLRLKINLIVGALVLGFIATLLGLQLRTLRAAIGEETVAANRVAAQLLDRTAWLYAAQGTPAMLAFLQGLGRIRSNEVALYDSGGALLYRSPPPSYKAGREAPAWFSALMAPAPAHRAIRFPDGQLVVQANASRAVLDAWDEISRLAGAGLLLLLTVHLLVFWGVGRTLRPLGRIVDALQTLRAGRLDVRLPPLPGREAAAIGSAFNRMAEQLGELIETEKRAVRAEAQLSENRALTQWLEQHIEAERKHIARELHDELGQSVTAMRSMALSIAQRSAGQDARTEQAARLIADEAARLYDAMHGIIPRLTPLVLDQLGLSEALADLAERTRRSHPGLALTLQIDLAGLRGTGVPDPTPGPAADGAPSTTTDRTTDTTTDIRPDIRPDITSDPRPDEVPGAPPGAPLQADVALTVYRTAQEGVTNALRHGQAQQISVQLRAADGLLVLQVCDDGLGLRAPDPLRSHHGLHWLTERARALGGTLTLEDRPVAAQTPVDRHDSNDRDSGSAPQRGTRLCLRLPVADGAAGAAALTENRALSTPAPPDRR